MNRPVLNAMNYLRTIDRDSPLVVAASNVTQQELNIARAFNMDPVVRISVALCNRPGPRAPLDPRF
jgi:hypothetical protein